jgi:heat shock protein HslJ
MGRYVQDAIGAGAIVFRSIATTKRMCEDPRMAVEERVINVLRSSTNVKVTGNTLRIDGSAGKLDFTAPIPLPPPPAPPTPPPPK